MPITVNIFCQLNTSRLLVGTLKQAKGWFVLQYDTTYLENPKALAIGPELPLKRAPFQARELFPSLQDRIPSKQNPAYGDYCQSVGISPEESDQLVLLSTIGQRGPSSFLFREAHDTYFTGTDLALFRKKLGLTVREFAVFLDTNPATITKTEQGDLQSYHLLALCEVLAKVPTALNYQLHKRGQYLHDDKIAQVKKLTRL